MSSADELPSPISEYTHQKNRVISSDDLVGDEDTVRFLKLGNEERTPVQRPRVPISEKFRPVRSPRKEGPDSVKPAVVESMFKKEEQLGHSAYLRRGPANIKDACGGLISRLMSSSLSVSSSTFSGPLCLASFAPFFFRQALAEGAFDDLLLALVVERDRDGAVLPFFLLFHSSSHFPPLVSHLSHFCLSRRV